jgi:glycerol uptake facilitator-like aquaporin
MKYSWRQQLVAEFVGTAALLCVVIGSGIMAERLCGGNLALALLANTFATVFALFVLIEIFGPVSGAHFNPIVSLWAYWRQSQSAQRNTSAQPAHVFAVMGTIAVQLAGAVCGAWLAHAMFEMNIVQTSSKLRVGWGQWLAEAIAAAGLIFVIARSGSQAVNARASALVACYIGAAYWFTASTSFANPAAVLGRMFSDSFAGIAPGSAPGIVVAQCVGAFAGAWLAKLFQDP